MHYAIPASILAIYIWGWYAVKAPITSAAKNNPRRQSLRHVVKRYGSPVLQGGLLAATAIALALSLLSDTASRERAFQGAMGILLALMFIGVWVKSHEV